MARNRVPLYPLVLLACSLLPSAGAAPQTGQRRVDKSTELLRVPEPIEVLEVLVKGRPVLMGQPFPAADDWLRGLTLKLRNISALTVGYVELQLEAIPPAPAQERVRLPLKRGRVPVTPSPTTEATPLSGSDEWIGPGDYFHLTLKDAVYDFAVGARPQAGGGRFFERAKLRLSHVVFAGDRAWRAGRISRRDPVNPLRWNVTDEGLSYIKPVAGVPGAGSPAPDFAVSDLAGRRFELAALRGKAVVLNFWSIACAPCRAEIPELNRLVGGFKNRGVVFLAVSSDGEAELRAFLKGSPFNFPVVPAGGAVIRSYGLEGFPSHVVIDQEGRIAWARTGTSPDIRAELAAAIEGLLSKKE